MSITYTSHDDLGLITCDDGKVNAMALPFFEALDDAIAKARADGVRALVITGRPGAFSAGLNLKLLPTLPPDVLSQTLRRFGRTLLNVFTCPIPTVAAITGHAIAGGTFLGMACDLRVMAEGPYRMHINEVAIGLPLPTWAYVIAASVVEVRWRTEAILHARPYTPAEALARNFVHEVVPAEQVLERARILAEPLKALDPAAYAATKTRTRINEVKWAEALIDEEMVALPPR